MLDRAFTKRMHCQCSFPLSTLYARPHHGAMAFGPVDAGSCFYEA